MEAMVEALLLRHLRGLHRLKALVTNVMALESILPQILVVRCHHGLPITIIQVINAPTARAILLITTIVAPIAMCHDVSGLLMLQI